MNTEQNPICTCGTCGWNWPRGQNGEHSCATVLLGKLSNAEEMLAIKEVYGNQNALQGIRTDMATKFMATLLQNPRNDFTADPEASAPMESWADFASGAVQAADALIAELAK